MLLAVCPDLTQFLFNLHPVRAHRPSQRRGSAAREDDRIWTAADAVVPTPLFSAPLGFQRAPSAALERAGPEAWGSKMRCDRPRLAASAACLPEVPQFFPRPSLSPGGWRAAPEVISPSPARGKHGGGLVHGAPIFGYF